MKSLALILLTILLFTSLGKAQEKTTYRTTEGKILFIFEFNDKDSSVKARSNKLKAIFDYRVPKLKLRADMKTFYAKDDKLDTALNAFTIGHMRFKGDMEIKDIGPDLNPRVLFPIEGYIQLNQKRRFVKMEGNLFPLQKTNRYRAQLAISTNLKLSHFNLKDDFPRFNDRFYIQIYQSVLNPRPNN